MNKAKLWSSYTYIERFRGRGLDLISSAKRWLRYDTIKQAILYGGIAKLSIPILKDVEWWQILLFVIVWSFMGDIINIIIGRWFYKTELDKVQANINSKDDLISPFNHELKLTLKSLCDKTGAEYQFKELE